jgi:regulator of replication initiation timing
LLCKLAKDTIVELRKTIESAAPEIRENLTELTAKLAKDRAKWAKDGLDEEECLQKEEEYLKERLSQEQMALEAIHPVDRSIMDRYQRYQTQVFYFLLYTHC